MLIRLEPAGAPAQPPWYHRIPGHPSLLFLVGGSRIYGVEGELPLDFRQLSPKFPAPGARMETYPSAISLNIAQSCNLACAYCYADEGRFGAAAQIMALETAQQAIRQLFAETRADAVSIGFIGGEPLLNRTVLHASVEYAQELAERRRLRITFGITTNGTLLEPRDLELFRSHLFAVTVSLDGAREVHAQVRPLRGRGDSFSETIHRIGPLLDNPGNARVAVRCTLTRRNLKVSEHLEALAEVGFTDIGVSPLRTGPDTSLPLGDSDWPVLLQKMREAADREWERVQACGSFRFTNLAVALRRLHQGAYEALPCRSAAGYVSVSAAGDYYTCHRTIQDRRFILGSAKTGPSPDARREFLAPRQVDRQEPCRSCWARYLCGGGCHAEVAHAGRAGCDYIRGWLEHCISLYPRVLAHRPDLLGEPARGVASSGSGSL